MRARTKQLSTLAAVALVMLATKFAAAADEQTPAALQPFAVVELFTSEGCSSCPPADKLLNELAADARKNGKRIFPLAFHVDYWNHLGWTDPFSSKAWSQRQHDYANVFRSGHIYTPQMIVNGTEQFVGSDRARATRGIEAALARPAKISVSLRTESNPAGVRYEVSNAPKDAVLHIALVERGLITKVGRGENSGRTLPHDNVVRVFETVRLREKSSGAIQMTAPSGVARENTTVIGYVQDSSTMAVLGAASQGD